MLGSNRAGNAATLVRPVPELLPLDDEHRDLGGGAWVELVRGFVPDHAIVMDRLVATLPLRSEQVVVFGRSHATPRLTSWHGDRGCAYAYSGRVFDPHPWTPDLIALRARLRDTTGIDFNSVLANYYRDGRDAMGMHADDERELGPTRDDVRIASISLGARRRFVLAERRGGDRHAWPLGEGDLLVMGGTTQRRYRHGVPRSAGAVGPRLNLTFRVVVA